MDASTGEPLPNAPTANDAHKREPRFLLLGKGAVFAHRFERSLAAELDDDQQS
jgi:hypothetical protein